MCSTSWRLNLRSACQRNCNSLHYSTVQYVPF